MANTENKDVQTESFADLLDESLGGTQNFEGTVLTGQIVKIDAEMVHVDVGLKSEGRISIKEFINDTNKDELKIGDSVDVFLDRLENMHGDIVLSREKARREEAWIALEVLHTKQEHVEGTIFSRVKGGFTVDLAGATAFLPGSQVDIRPIRDIAPLMNTPQPFLILKMDRERGNIVVSRRAVLEESRAEARGELISNLHEGQELEGIVKNITDYGAFIDLGGIDGLLHVTDISWKRINHPSEILKIGQTVKVKIIKFDQETSRISLGLKQLEADPWQEAAANFEIGKKYSGRVSNITDYGAFVELAPGVEGLIHHSELSWTKKNIHPGKVVSTSEEVEVMILDMEPEKRRISLGLKQCTDNPWTHFSDTFHVDDVIEGEVRNITDFGLFVALSESLEGLVHASDIDWTKSDTEALSAHKKGDVIKCKILEINIEKERVSLGIKQMSENPLEKLFGQYSKGQIITCTISALTDNGIKVTIGDGDASYNGFIKKNDLAKERYDQRMDRFAVGEKVDAKITHLDQNGLTLSIKAREVEDEKRVMKEYGSSDSGASLGDILGAALSKSDDKKKDVPKK